MNVVAEGSRLNACICMFAPPPGIVVAVLGEEQRDGSFKVEDYCSVGLPDSDIAMESADTEMDTNAKENK